MLTAKGHNGAIGFDGERITIERSGLPARHPLSNGTKVLPLKQVSAVQWKPAKLMAPGFIEMTIGGGNEQRGGTTRTENRLQNFDNENAVIFGRKQEEEMRAVYDAILSAI